MALPCLTRPTHKGRKRRKHETARARAVGSHRVRRGIAELESEGGAVMVDPLVRRVYRELTEPERVAWARLMALRCSAAIRRGKRFTVVVGRAR